MPTVLIVDDDKHTRSLLRHVFEVDPRFARLGIVLVEAAGGEEALSRMAANRPDVVITDLLMPGMDGFQLCESIRKRVDGAKVGLIVVSGAYREPSVEVRVRQQFNGHFFAKPYEIRDVADTVHGLITDPARRAQAAPAPAQDLSQAGTLSDKSLPQLLFELWERRASGLLELKRAGLEKKIDLVSGHPVAVSSNQRSETLGQLLVARKMITAEQHQAALRKAHDEGDRMGQVLVEQGVLTAPQLVAALTAQARIRIVRALRWSDGQWSYSPQRDANRPRGNAFDPALAILSGLKQTVRLELAMETVRKLGDGGLALTPRGERVAGQIAKVFGEALLLGLRGGASVTVLISSTSEPTSVIRALDVLLECACVTSQPAVVERARRESEVSQAFAMGSLTASKTPTAQSLKTMPVDPIALGEPERELPAPVPEPIDDPEESGVIEISAIPDDEYQAETSFERERSALLAEFLRVQGVAPSEVLGVAAGASQAELDRALAERLESFSLTRFQDHDLGADHDKIDEIHAAYLNARQALRQASAQPTATRGQAGPLAGELAFTRGEVLLASADVSGAVAAFEEAVARVPDSADYHAALAWARYRLATAHGPLQASMGQAVLAPARRALEIDPDLGAAHEALGRAFLDLGKDDEAARHLEAALAARPPRDGALGPLEALRARLGEEVLLEPVYAQLADQEEDKAIAARAALALANRRNSAGDREGARQAAARAMALDPEEPAAPRLLAALEDGDAARWPQRAQALRAWWRLDPQDPAPGRALLAGARAAGEHDAAFVTAALLTVRDPDAALIEQYYKKDRPRFLPRAMERTLELATAGSLRHPEDEPVLSKVFATIAPLCDAVDPIGLAGLFLAPDDEVADGQLGDTFKRVRAWVSEVLAVEVPQVFVRGDLDAEIHVAAPEAGKPVLLCGPGALAQEDRLALGFALGRAMTYMWPGRALAAARPARRLRALLLACLGAESTAAETQALHAAARAKVESLGQSSQALLRRELAALSSGRHSLNLSRWVRAMARTADRVGLLLCADPAVALRGAEALSGPEAARELFAWAVSPAHLQTRERLGRSIAV